jgi:hypothetical protein
MAAWKEKGKKNAHLSMHNIGGNVGRGEIDLTISKPGSYSTAVEWKQENRWTCFIYIYIYIFVCLLSPLSRVSFPRIHVPRKALAK